MADCGTGRTFQTRIAIRKMLSFQTPWQRYNRCPWAVALGAAHTEGISRNELVETCAGGKGVYQFLMAFITGSEEQQQRFPVCQALIGC